MAAPLFAMARPAIAAVLGQMFTKPQTAGQWLGMAGRFAPEFVFPAINAFNLPEGASAADRGIAGLEALGLGLGGSLGGEILGGLGGLAFSRSRGMRPGGRRERRDIDIGLQLGGNIGGIAANFLPMPFTNSIYEREIRRQQERDTAMQGLDTADLYTDIAGLGAMAAQPLFDPRLLM